MKFSYLFPNTGFNAFQEVFPQSTAQHFVLFAKISFSGKLINQSKQLRFNKPVASKWTVDDIKRELSQLNNGYIDEFFYISKNRTLLADFNRFFKHYRKIFLSESAVSRDYQIPASKLWGSRSDQQPIVDKRSLSIDQKSVGLDFPISEEVKYVLENAFKQTNLILPNINVYQNYLDTSEFLKSLAPYSRSFSTLSLLNAKELQIRWVISAFNYMTKSLNDRVGELKEDHELREIMENSFLFHRQGYLKRIPYLTLVKSKPQDFGVNQILFDPVRYITYDILVEREFAEEFINGEVSLMPLFQEIKGQDQFFKEMVTRFPNLLAHQNLPVFYMVKCIETKNAAEVKRLLDLDIGFRFLMKEKVIDAYNKSSDENVIELFTKKYKEYQETYRIKFLIQASDDNDPYLFRRLMNCTIGLGFDDSRLKENLAKIPDFMNKIIGVLIPKTSSKRKQCEEDEKIILANKSNRISIFNSSFGLPVLSRLSRSARKKIKVKKEIDKSSTARLTYNTPKSILHPITPGEWKTHIKKIRTISKGKISDAKTNCTQLSSALANGIILGEFFQAPRPSKQNSFIFNCKVERKSVKDGEGNKQEYLTAINSFTSFSAEKKGLHGDIEIPSTSFIEESTEGFTEKTILHADIDKQGFSPKIVLKIALMDELKKMAKMGGGWSLVNLGFYRITPLSKDSDYEKAENDCIASWSHHICAYVVTPEFNHYYGNHLQQQQLITFLEPQNFTKNQDEPFISHSIDEICTMVAEGMKIGPDDDIFDQSISLLVLNSHNSMLSKEKLPTVKTEDALKAELMLAVLKWSKSQVKSSSSSSSFSSTSSFFSSSVSLAHYAGIYGFTCHDIKKDGNCFYHSVSHQLAAMGLMISSERLSELVVDHIIQNQTLYTDSLNGSMDFFINKFNIPGEWADAIQIIALSRVLNVDVIVIRSDGLALNGNLRPPKDMSNGKIYLGYDVDVCYQSLISHDLSRHENLSVPVDNQFSNKVTFETLKSRFDLQSLFLFNKN